MLFNGELFNGEVATNLHIDKAQHPYAARNS